MSNFDKYLHLLLDYFSVLFSERVLHNVYDMISDNFRLGLSSSIRGPGSDVLLFSFIVEYCVFVYTCVFLNRIASFEKLGKLITSIKTQFLPKMVDSHNKTQTDHA